MSRVSEKLVKKGRKKMGKIELKSTVVKAFSLFLFLGLVVYHVVDWNRMAYAGSEKDKAPGKENTPTKENTPARKNLSPDSLHMLTTKSGPIHLPPGPKISPVATPTPVPSPLPNSNKKQSK